MEWEFWEFQKSCGSDSSGCHDVGLAKFVSECHMSVMGHNSGVSSKKP